MTREPGDERAPVADASGRAPRLVHEPALDGLRGVAVAAVVAFHLERVQGGFLGVDLFFVLSGFLITSLLLREAAGRGGIGLRAFWARRARRLLPALWLLLVGVGGLLLWLTPSDQRPLFRDDALATLGYVANWQRLAATTSYWELFSQKTPLEHMWSLAIEEQFYLVWPLVIVLLLRARRRAENVVRNVALVGAAISLAWMAVSFKATDTNWAYYSTPTRLGPTLLGAALAAVAVTTARRTKPHEPHWDVLAVAALVVMALLVFGLNGGEATYYRGGLAIFALCSCLVIWAVTGGPAGPVAQLLSLRPARWLGRISYGVYLWHWPVIVYVSTAKVLWYTPPASVRLSRFLVDLLRIALTLGLASLSYRFVEQPIRRGALKGRAVIGATAGAVVVTLVVVVVATTGRTKAETIDLDNRDKPLREGIDNPIMYIPKPATVPDGALKVLLVGDSGSAAWGPQLVKEAERHRTSRPIAMAFTAQVSCTIVYADGSSMLVDGKLVEREDCDGVRRKQWRAIRDAFDPDVVVYYLANAGFTESYWLNGEWVPECDPRYDAYLADALSGELDLLGSKGAEAVIATSPYTGTMLVGTGHVVDCRNATYRRVAASRPGTRVADLNGFVSEQPEDVEMFADPVHLSETGGRRAARWLLPQLAAWWPSAEGSGAPQP